MFFKRYSIKDIISKVFNEYNYIIELRKGHYKCLSQLDSYTVSSKYVDVVRKYYYDFDYYDIFYIKDEVLASLLYKYSDEQSLSGLGLDNCLAEFRFIKRKKDKYISYVICKCTRHNHFGDKLIYGCKIPVNLKLEGLSLNYSTLFSNFSDGEDYKFSVISSLRPYNYVPDPNDISIAISFFRNRYSDVDKALGYSTQKLLNRGALEVPDLHLTNAEKEIVLKAIVFKKFPETFENIQEFLKAEYHLFGAYEEPLVDEDDFVKTLTYHEETDEFVIYEDNHNAGYKVYKLKNFETVKILRKNNTYLEFFNVKVLTSLDDTKHYLVVDEEGVTFSSLKSFIEQDVKQQTISIGKRISDLVTILHYKYSWLKDIYFADNANILELFTYMDTNINEVNGSINEIRNISFKPMQGYSKITISHIIIRFIDYYREIIGYSIQDLYKMDFMKILPYSLGQKVISICQSKQYNLADLDSRIENFKDFNLSNKIEFLENISDEATLSKICLFKELEKSEIGNKIHAIKNRISSLPNWPNSNVQPSSFSFEDRAKKLKPFISKFVQVDSALENLYLIPEKIIISNSRIVSNNYDILGVIWNKNVPLYSFLQLVKEKAIDTKQLYQVIVKLMAYYKCSCGYEPLDNVFVDSKLEVTIFNPKANLTIKNYRYSFASLYNKIIEEIKEKCVNSIQAFDLLEYSEGFGACEREYYAETIIEFNKLVDKLSLCEEHKRWHFQGELCPECSKIYYIGSIDTTAPIVYQDKVSRTCKFFRSSYYYIRTVSKKSMNKYERLVKTGLINNLYASISPVENLGISKIAVSCDNGTIKPIGFLQKRIDYSKVINLDAFSTNQRLKVVLTFINYILPLIEQGTFLCEDIRIFTTSFMHKDFKGEILFPNIFLLETDAIISNSQQLKDLKILNTKKAFANFLVNYILKDELFLHEYGKKDSTITKAVEKFLKLDFATEEIKEYINLNNRYCKTHNLYFSDKDCICYECRQNGISKPRTIVETSKYFEKLQSVTPKFDGGEANLYDFKSGTKIQKIFKPCVNLELKSKIIGKVLNREKKFKKFNEENPSIQFVMIDSILYEENKGCVELKGYTQNQIQGAYKISCLKDKEFVNTNNISHKHVIEILQKICKGIEFIHSLGGFIGDLNGGNILIKEDTVYFIDFDGMSFDEVKNCVFTNLYIYPPSAEQNNITAADDWYSLAVQAFYYLTHSHPFRGISTKRDVPQDEIERMKKGCSVLGAHRIKPPVITKGWDFMPDYMLNFFLDTFEGTKRESMFEVLHKYSTSMYKGGLTFSKVETKNEVKFSLYEDIYVDVDNFVQYKEHPIINLLEGHLYGYFTPESCVVYGNHSLCLIDRKTEKKFITTRIPMGIQCICDNNIYYLGNGRTTLFVDSLSETEETPTTHIVKDFPAQSHILAVGVSNNRKFVFVIENKDTHSFEIYCNSTLFYSCNSFEFTKVDVEYDKLSNKWIVLFNKNEHAEVIVIKDDKTYEKLQISDKISKNWCFYGNVIYYVKDGEICHYNINTKLKASILCEAVNTQSAVLRDANKFIIVNEKECYVYTKT
ncbi:MAG: hypothetical protein IKV94_03175 [Clostridia bacterium]|nr:hypothetical protein [Clostridia bacterium]